MKKFIHSPIEISESANLYHKPDACPDSTSPILFVAHKSSFEVILDPT